MKHLPDIQCKVIPHESHRYNTVGDYIESKYRGGIDRVNFKVSEMNADYEFLVLIHELIEYYLVKRKGIDLEAIDEFDMEFEKNRKKDDNSEAGENCRRQVQEYGSFRGSPDAQVVRDGTGRQSGV